MSMLVLAAAFAGGLFTSWAIGATNAPAFGPVNSAHAATIYRSSLLVGLFSLLGAVTQGSAVANTVGSELVVNAPFTAVHAAIILLTASSLIIVSTLLKYPLPTVFTVLGGVAGTAFAVGATLNTDTVARIGLFWAAIPVVGMAIGYGTAWFLREHVPKTERNKTVIRRVLLLLGMYTAYIAGANQAGLPIGPLLNAVDVPLSWLLAFAGVGMLLGAWTLSPRIVEAVSRDYSRMGPRRAIAALLAASLIAQVATLYGVPVSFSQTVIFSVIGAGLVEGRSGVGKEKILKTVAVWAIAFFTAMAVTFALTGIVL